MEYLLTAEEMSAADRHTSENIGIPSLVLMERAALGVAYAVREDFPTPGPHAGIAVVAGKGNNGADALAAGRILLDAGYEVTFFLAGEDSGPAEQRAGAALSPDAGERRRMSSAGKRDGRSSLEIQAEVLRNYGADLQPFSAGTFRNLCPDGIIDGLFGTGLSRDVREPYLSVIKAIQAARNDTGARVFSVDIPSGIDGSTGEVRGAAVQADVTVTFAFYKRGHFLYPGCEYCGKVRKAEIGITERSFRALQRSDTAVPELFTYTDEEIQALLPFRDPSGNKGTFGKVLVIAGSKGVSGACTMCALAALRTGAGMVKVFTHEANRVILQTTVPEAMVSTYYDREKEPADPSGGQREERKDSGGDPDCWSAIDRQLSEDIRWAGVIAIGPGLGKTETALHLVCYVLAHADGRKLVIDADAIRLIAEHDLYDLLRRAGERETVVLTPHMAECAALLQMPIEELKIRRFTAIKKFTGLYKCTIIGKDARSLVASSDSKRQYLNTSGNDGLSTAGSGDVLTGITAGCLAQGMSGFEGACAAAFLHGRLADRLAQKMNKRSITATDLIRELSLL